MTREDIDRYISELKPISHEVEEETLDETRRVIIRCKENKLFLETYFEEPEETVLNVFKGTECIFALCGDTQGVFEKAKEWAY